MWKTPFFCELSTFERRALTTPQHEAHSTKRLVKGECTEKKMREEVGNSMIRGEVGRTSGEKETAASFYDAIDNFNRRLSFWDIISNLLESNLNS